MAVIVNALDCFFFFSSRRRHTRYWRDWSSDVCSSDLKPGGERFNKFLERNKLNTIKGVDKVLKDIIEDRNHMEKDGVITFESFKLLESEELKIGSLSQCLYKGIERADGKMEKILADYFDSSLGQIDVVDSSKHVFKVENWKSDTIYVTIYSKEEVNIISENMIEHLYGELSKKKVELSKSISIDLSSLINYNSFQSKMKSMFNHDFLMKIITECLIIYEYKGDSEGYSIWVKNDQYM